MPFELDVIPDLKNTKNMNQLVQKEKEGELILKKLQAGDMLVLLDENGTTFSSIGFSDYLQKKMNTVVPKICALRSYADFLKNLTTKFWAQQKKEGAPRG